MPTRNTENNNLKDLQELRKNSAQFQILLDNTLALKENTSWWKTQFDKAALPTPIAADGSGQFRMMEIVEAGSPMLNPRALWSPPKEESSAGAEYYSDSLWDWGKSFSTTPQEQAYYEKMLALTNVPVAVLSNYINTLAAKEKGANATITYISASLLSSGQWSSANTEGFKAKGRCNEIPESSFLKAGKKTWDNPDADIYGFLVDTVQKYRDTFNDDRMLSLKIDKDTFKNIQNNTWFKENIGVMVILGGTYNPNAGVTLEKYNSFAAENGMLPIIEIMEEQQTIQDNSYVAKTSVRGWKKGSAVLSPYGKQGVIQYADVEELSYLVKGGSERSIGFLEGGLFGFLNWTESGRQQRYITELLGTFAPALGHFKHMFIIDTLTAE